MMYKFVDVNEVPAGSVLPAEAMKFNGTYFEREIPGYRTLHVSGREAFSAEISERIIQGVDGAQFVESRLPTRTLTVTYQIIAADDEAYRAAFNKLNGLLNVERVKVLFNDEPGKYFIGTRSSCGDVEPGRNCVTGEIEIYCLDPRKYSTVMKEFTAIKNEDGVMEATIINEGTVPVAIDYEVCHSDESGFVGIISEQGAMQYGSADELDKEKKAKSQRLINYKDGEDFAAMTNGLGTLTESTILKNGTFKTVTLTGKKYLALADVGSGPYWHGASKRIVIPADSNGVSGTNKYTLTAKVWYETGFVKQTGLLEVIVEDTNGEILQDVHIHKGSPSNNIANFTMRVGGKDVKTINYEPTYEAATKQSDGDFAMTKTGELFEFKFGGKKYHFRNAALANRKAAAITVFLGQFGTRGGGSNLVTRMYLYSMSFKKNNVTYYADIPNRYQEGDVCTIDGAKTKFYVNGVNSTEDEVLGTKYFMAPPGTSKVQFVVSDWCDKQPTAVARIREAYL
ncbi:distal tail protein Dit [Hespellia stercorisuis]|uniref:Putative phage tail component, N-terminal domain-containing protein n=1 Tax=Hespellia stercorisuis DSM 15480 TaxID=1121950 RepID=A0A1M6RH23_9FIRM|nr:distal tail protein Dit [Hespellia stercorisuis]SHK31678.1 putative phage tail component, N-terminal domain-containing protein [Hespellia stercorisuis DSM 15480]